MKYSLTTVAKCLAIFLLSSCFISSKCNKEEALGEYYFRCKIDGETYRPNSCANCMTAQILGDTVIMLQGNRDFEALTIGVINKPAIEATSYLLNDNISSRGTYKYSTTVNDRYFTNATHTGMLLINTLNKQDKVVSGTFYYKAYNSYTEDSISITDGKFRLQYTDY
ncbi:MAG: DUF6252 family protein [Agriterribacter sp.]